MIASITMISMPAKAQLSTTQPTAGALPLDATPSITVKTVSYLSVSPNPIGVNQELLINVWTQPPINVNRQYIGSYNITITKPDGTKDVIVLSSYPGDATSWTSYMPDQLGNYTVQFNFIGEYFPAGQYLSGYIVTNSSGQKLNSAYYSPSSSPPQTLVVQQDMIASWPPSPLPTDYWTRPVSINNRDWWTILGSYPPTGYGPVNPAFAQGVTWDSLYPNTDPYWSSTENFVPWVQAPNTAHIVWSRANGIGGLIGGQLGDVSAQPDPIPGYPNIIFDGRCYQTLSKVYNGVTQNVWESYDLQTGQIYWDKTDSSTFNVAQAPTFVSYTERSGQAVVGEAATLRGVGVTLGYIGNGRLIKYDPFTGATLVNVSIAPLTTSTYYLNEYALGVQDLGAAAGANRYRLINWTTNDNGEKAYTTGGNTVLATNFQDRIISNISWPISSLPATTDFNAGITVYVTAINPPGISGTGVTIGQGLVGINIKTGEVLWNVTTVETGDGSEQFFSSNNCVADNGVFIARMITGTIVGWNLYNGQVMWKTQLPYPWGEFGPYHVATGYGLYLNGAYDGLFALNETNGNIVWNFHAYTPYQFETPFQTGIGSEEYPFHIGVQIADGKVYSSVADHSPKQPIQRGYSLYALNVTTGEELWHFSGSQLDSSRVFTGAISQGYLVWGSQYDATIYSFGKGQSTTTIEAPLTTIPRGQGIVLQGTVLDESPAQPGTPAVSAQSMSAWMNHLHAQGPIPANLTGVPVSIDAVDPSGNFVHIADVTSDRSGTFSYIWKPDLVGKYSVTATFMGDDSYGSSYAETNVGVVEAPTASPAFNVVTGFATANDVMTYSLIAAVAVIIALAVAVLLLRKRQ